MKKALDNPGLGIKVIDVSSRCYRGLQPCKIRRIVQRMNVALEIPEAISDSLRSGWKDVPRRALEAIAAEAYRSAALTAHQVGQLLGHKSRWETEEFLKRVGAWLSYTEADLDRDLATLRAARG